MFRRKAKQHARERATEYATCRDFQQIFNEDMVGLHRLAFLLTADQAKAEQCFVAGLEESIRGNPVFRQWARAWSKRAIIQNAIKMIAPVPPKSGTVKEAAARSAQNGNRAENSEANVEAWEPFERFVFVMAVLEGYSLRECSTLLACPVQDVAAAKSAGLQRLGGQPRLQQPVGPQTETFPWRAAFFQTQVA
jgi:DNA-directed RNA polymerase specialized sigma24 family protein